MRTIFEKKHAVFFIASIITASSFAKGSYASSLSDDELLGKYVDKFHVIESALSADSERLQNESYMQNKVYADGILYAAYPSVYDMEYDWTEYVECIADEIADSPRIVRNYHNCKYDNGFYYSVDDGTATVHGADTVLFSDAETILIPDMLGGFPVQEIAPNAFNGFEGAVFPNLREISIPDSVERICCRAFYGVFKQERNQSLSNCKINIPESVRYIGKFAYGFGTVRALPDTVNLPDTLEYIDQMAFTDNSVQVELFNDSQSSLVITDAAQGKAPYLLSEEGYEPLPAVYYPDIVLPESVYVCNDDYIVIQRGVVKKCRNALCPKQYAEYYLRENLSNPQGDVNVDGQVNTADAVYMQKYLSGSLTAIPAFPFDWKSGDVNADGKINAIDLTLLKRMLIGI